MDSKKFISRISKTTKTLAASALLITSTIPNIASATSLVTFGNPWGQISGINGTMDASFGAGNWTGYSSPANTNYLSGESFVYFEGGDDTTNAMENHLTTNTTTLLNWVSGGGNLFINAAPNQGDGLSFGGLTLSYPSTYCSTGCTATDPTHEIFDGITDTNFTGNHFSHGTVSGGTSLIEDASGDSLLAELAYGAGKILMGTMTTINFHKFGDAADLRTNILQYGADANLSPVPVPAAAWLFGSALLGLFGFSRRKRSSQS